MEKNKEPKGRKPPKNVDALLAEGDLMSLVELQKFLSDEIAPAGHSDYSRSFLPLTDGLGLASPPKRSECSTEDAPAQAQPAPTKAERRRSRVDELFASDPIPEVAPPNPTPEPRKEPGVTPKLPLFDDEEGQEILPTERVATRTLVQPPPAPIPIQRTERPEPAKKAAPPPMPAATFFRRLMAGFLDQIFVLTIWAASLAITAGLLRGDAPDVSTAVLREFTNPQFVRFAAMEFAVIWLAYLALSIGVLDMTFGMWVWGLRLTYPGAKDDRAFLRKMLRVTLAFFFYAPILPTALLVLRHRGRNLLDWMSGTSLYRTMA